MVLVSFIFLQASEMTITNSVSKKRSSHLITLLYLSIKMDYSRKKFQLIKVSTLKTLIKSFSKISRKKVASSKKPSSNTTIPSAGEAKPLSSIKLSLLGSSVSQKSKKI